MSKPAANQRIMLGGSPSRRAMPINNPPTAASFCPDGSGHRWTIETPNGPTARGVCKRCGGEREFQNSGSENVDFNDEATFVRGLGRVVGW